MPELRGKKVYKLLEDSDFTQREFYYDYENNKMYQINQGMWFIINEEYKNVTPKDSPVYNDAEAHRKSILASKINFTLEEAEAIAKEKQGDYGFIDVGVTNDIEVLDGIKLYMGTGLTDSNNSRTINFWVGSDGNIYNFSGISVEGKFDTSVS